MTTEPMLDEDLDELMEIIIKGRFPPKTTLFETPDGGFMFELEDLEALVARLVLDEKAVLMLKRREETSRSPWVTCNN